MKLLERFVALSAAEAGGALDGVGVEAFPQLFEQIGGGHGA